MGQPVTIAVITICRNEGYLMPHFLRHYERFADEIHVWDEQSTDGTREAIAGCNKAFLHEWTAKGFDDFVRLEFCHEIRNKFLSFDWTIWPDVDEFIYADNVQEKLLGGMNPHYGLPRVVGYQMLWDGELPISQQITEVIRSGVRDEIYDKPIIIPAFSNIAWYPGKHRLKPLSKHFDYPAWMGPEHLALRLLHYRFLGEEYFKTRNAKNFSRFTNREMDAHRRQKVGWHVAPDHKGKYDLDWYRENLKLAKPVI